MTTCTHAACQVLFMGIFSRTCLQRSILYMCLNVLGDNTFSKYGCGRCISVISCVCEWKMCLCTMFVFVYKELCFLHRQHGMAHGLADYVGTVL